MEPTPALWPESAQAPRPAAASVERGIRVEATKNHRNEAAGGGCSVAACWVSIGSESIVVEPSPHAHADRPNTPADVEY